MKRLFTVFATMMVASSLFAETSVYKKVISAPTDWTGTYLIVCEDQNVVFNGGASEEDLDAKSGPAILQDITFPQDGTLTGTDALDAATFSISATDNEDWPWAIQSKSGYYIGHKDTIDNGLSVETEIKDKCKHTLAIDADGNFVATPKYSDEGAGAEGNVYTLQYNKKDDQMRFRYYVTGDKKSIQIYKLDETSGITEVKTSTTAKPVKQLIDGQVVIRKDNSTYTIQGIRR